MTGTVTIVFVLLFIIYSSGAGRLKAAWDTAFGSVSK